MTNEIRKPEVSERILESTEIRTSEYSTLAALMGMEDSTNARCWQGETELGVGLGFGSSLTRQKESCFSPYAGFEILEKSRSTQLGTPKHHRPGHGVFTCFRHSTLNLVWLCFTPVFRKLKHSPLDWIFALSIVTTLLSAWLLAGLLAFGWAGGSGFGTQHTTV